MWGFNPRAREGRDAAKSASDAAASVFQPTRPRGARRQGAVVSEMVQGFNPRAREGRDCNVGCLTIKEQCFNPRAREGRDIIGKAIRYNANVFQPTRPRGARLSLILSAASAWMFQPTRPRGARRSGGSAVNYRIRVSTHAPARGATQGCPDLHAQSCRFNPRAREGRDADVIDAKRIWSSFNPRAREGRDTTSMPHISRWMKFQPTRPRGARRCTRR